MTDFTFRTGHQASDFILQCEYSGENCSYEDFSHVFSHHGNCFTFNKHDENNAVLLSKRAGTGNGLRLILGIETEEYTPSNDLDGDAMDAGIKLLVHGVKEPPYVKELGFVASPGFHTYVSLRKALIYGLPYPYGECLEVGSMKYFDHYSMSACRIECETYAVEEMCGCRLVEQPGDGTWPVCSANQTHLCAHPSLVDYNNGHLDINCSCREPCDVEDYPHVVTMSKLRPAFIEKLFHNTKHNMSETYIEQNVAVLSIFYEALNMETITQLPDTDGIILLSQIGGNMGLFLGASILTVVQLGEFLFDFMRAKMRMSGQEEYSGRAEKQIKNAWDINSTDTSLDTITT
ncbi:acid-sensing ion channel 2-like [Saccoglossus kowalevskii]